MESMGDHAEELSHLVSQTDLTTIFRRSDTSDSQLGRRYQQDDLIRLRPTAALALQQGDNFYQESVKTPPQTRALSSTLAVPFSPATAAVKDSPTANRGTEAAFHESDKSGIATGTQSYANMIEAVEPVRKEKNKKSLVSGFEEYYADPPLTPTEHEEEEELYSTTRPFTTRIEHCIQRYRHKRKFDSFRANVFTKWLTLGGIDASNSKSFTGGLDRETVETSTADEIAAIRATDYIRGGIQNAKFYDPEKPEGWVIDFTGVMKGFLSHYIFEKFDIRTGQDVRAVTAVLRNFLNYILLHNVCPEYKDDILEARRICNLAEHEIPLILDARRFLPGDFNIAASSLYGGRYKDAYVDVDDNASDEWGVAFNSGFDIPKAEHVFKTAIAIAGTDELFTKVMGADVEHVKTARICFEVIQVRCAIPKIIEEYAQAKDAFDTAGITKPIGLLVVKRWDGPGFEAEDLTDDERESKNKGNGVADGLEDIETFWLEDETLQHCFEGMKLELTVHDLNIGIKYFDAVDGVYCSFFEYLPNVKMSSWKEPIPNPRPPRTEADPNVGKKGVQATTEREHEELEEDMLTEEQPKEKEVDIAGPAARAPTA